MGRGGPGVWFGPGEAPDLGTGEALEGVAAGECRRRRGAAEGATDLFALASRRGVGPDRRFGAGEDGLDLLGKALLRRQGLEDGFGPGAEVDGTVLLTRYRHAADLAAGLGAQLLERQIQGLEPHARRRPADRRIVVRKLAVDGAVGRQLRVVVDADAGDDAECPIVAVAARRRDLDQERRQALGADVDAEVEGAAAHSMRVLYR